MRSFLVAGRWSHRRGRGGDRSAPAGFGLVGAAIVAFLLGACGPDSAPNLAVEDAWVRAMPPGVAMTAAYGVFTWSGPQPLVVTGWSSEEYADVSLHRTVQSQGVSRMEAVPRPVIEPGERLVLEPGGLHLMLMQPLGEIAPGDTVSLTVISDSGRRFRFDLEVAAR